MTPFLKLVGRAILPAPWRFRHWVPQSLKKLVAKQCGNQVATGPFAGLRLPDESYCSVHTAKLIGCYERELNPSIETIISWQPDLVVNIGAAEGYYAAGFAIRLPNVSVRAFEYAPEARRLLEKTIQLNDLTGRVAIAGECTIPGLRECLQQTWLKRVVVCDCDGPERFLLNPSELPELVGCAILVETHEFLDARINEDLKARFAPTHQIIALGQTPRSAADFPFRSWVTVLAPAGYRLAAVSEQRPAKNEWLFMQPLAVAKI